jgi:quercetin dioxygenase-like cupin family protein
MAVAHFLRGASMSALMSSYHTAVAFKPDLTIAVLEGEGTLALGDHEEAIGPGTVAFAPAGTARGLRAATRLVVLNVVTPPPTDADHAGVAAGLRRGRWR